MTQKKSLYDFLVEAELSQYHKQFLDELKVTTLSQVKYVTDVDLLEIGMTKPEIRRLNKFFKKHCSQGTLNKLKEILIRGQEELNASVSRPGANKTQPPVASETVEIDAESIVIQSLIEEGEFGHVYQGTWKRDSSAKTPVAVKTIKRSLLTRSTSDFLRMMAEIQRLRHDNLLYLYGVALREDSIMLVMELAPFKSLLLCISSQSSRANYPVWKLCGFAHQVASGMEFLEKQGLVHRDLSARNVLVFEGNLVKVSDTGLTQALGVGMDHYQRNVSFNLKLPAAWCAPECVTCEAFTSSSDVWAFGVTLWEMFSYGFQPWAGFTGKQIVSSISLAEGSQRLNQPDSCPSDFYDVMQNCWKHNPRDRPTFSQIVMTLKEIKPIRMQVFGDRPSFRSDCLNCRTNDVLTVLEKKPKNPPAEGMWKGVMESNGRVGFFDPGCTMPFVDLRTSESTARDKITRKYSSRRSLRSDQRLHSGMISAPQTDLRHLGHVGYDGAVFGDVAFIGHNYDRLPFKVKTPERDTVDARMSTRSLTMNDLVPGGRSFLSLNSDCLSSGTSFDISPGTSVSMSPGASLFSPDIGTFDISPQLKPDSASDPFDQRENVALDSSFDDFSIPDISGSIGLDFSILDEMMKSLGKLEETEDDVEIVPTRLSIHEERDLEEVDEEDEEQRLSRVRSSSGTPSQRQEDSAAGNGFDSSFPSVTWSDLARREKEKTPYGELLKLSSLSKDSEIKECNRSLSDEFRSNYSARSSSDRFSISTSPNLPSSQLPEFTIPLYQNTGHDRGSSIPQRGLRFDLHQSQASSSNAKGIEEGRMDGNSTTRMGGIDEGSGGGVLSRIGSALSRRTETRMKRSLQNQIPSSSSSSAEFLPGAEKFPPRGGQKSTSSSLPRDASLRSGEAAVETRRPMSFLREGRSFGKTKAKIRSSVSSVINGRSAASKKDPPTNLNVNLPFFDRLREQELEKARLEELQARRLQCEEPQDGARESMNLTNRDQSRSRDRDEAGRGDYVTRPLGLRRMRNFESDSQTDEGIQISHSVSNMRNGFAAGSSRLLEAHDSSHDSEQSSMTHQSDDGIFADDSELDSPEGRAVGPESRPSACCSVSRTNTGLGVTAAAVLSRGAGRLELNGDDRGQRYDAPPHSAVLSCDVYEDAMESVLDGPFCLDSSNLEETAANKVQLVTSAFENVQMEDSVHAATKNGWDVVEATEQTKVKLLVNQGLGTVEGCQEALGLCGWNMDDALTYLRAHPMDQESPEYVHV